LKAIVRSEYKAKFSSLSNQRYLLKEGEGRTPTNNYKLLANFCPMGKIKEGVKLCMGRGGLGTTRSYRAHPRFFLFSILSITI